MKRFSRWPSIEELEDKRLKAADLATGHTGDAPPVIEAASVTAGGTTSTSQLRALEQLSAKTASLTSEESGDEQDGDETENDADDTDDTDETGDTDETDGDDNESDDNQSDGADDNGTDGTDDNGTDSDDNETDDSDDENGDDNETDLTATLTATTGNAVTSAKAEFESETDGGTTEREFSLKVSGVMTNGTLVTGMQEVRVGGVLVGSIDLTDGSGKLEFNSDPDGDETDFPADFPATVDSTTTVEVGPAGTPILTGTFGTSSDLQSLSSLQAVPVSSSLTAAPQALFADDSGSLGSAPSFSSSLPAASAATQNVNEASSVDLNLLDAGFAATADPLDSWALTEFQPHRAADDTALDGSSIDDALFEALVEGYPFWTA